MNGEKILKKDKINTKNKYMTKNNILPKVEEIKNIEEQIIKEKFDWVIKDNNYQKKATGEIFNANNFTPEQNQKMKNCLEMLEIFKQRGRAGKIRKDKE